MGLISRGLDLVDSSLGRIEEASLGKQIKKNRNILEQSSKPLTLLLAEFILLIISAIYICKICVLACGYETGFGDRNLSAIMYFLEIGMLFIAIRGLLGVSSRKPSSWAAVVRGSGLMLIMGALAMIASSPLSASSLVNIDVWYAVVLTVPVIILMCRKSVREYYTPPMLECKPLKYWILTCFGFKLNPGEGYRLSYK